MSSATLFWLLAAPPTPASSSPPLPMPPLFGAGSDCPLVGYTQDELLAVVARSYPADWLFGLQSSPTGGYEILQVAAKIMARVSEAIGELYCCSLFAFAHGPVKSTGLVVLERDTDAGGAVTVGSGSLVEASKSGRRYALDTAVVFGPTDLGPFAVSVTAIEEGREYDVQGNVATANGLLEGEIDTLRRLSTTSAGFDASLRVHQEAPTSGGLSACLDGLGNDVLVFRQPLEADDRYRLRILETPDTVSPDAITRGLDRILGALGLHACLREVGSAQLPGMFFDAGSSSDAPQDPIRNFAYDMDFTARPVDRFKLLLSSEEFRAFFLVGVPRVVERDFGAVFDGSTTDAFPLQNAYDTTSATAPNAAFDGSTLLAGSLYQSIYAMVEAKRAGGVGWELYLETVGCD